MPASRRVPVRVLVVALLVGVAALTACTATPELPPEGTVYPILCPVTGTVSFSNDWHAPRSAGTLHEGNDIVAPRGRPNVAVVDGKIRRMTGDKSGNAIWLTGDDGNDYFYAHLDNWYGKDNREVEAGDRIGYTGDTGNATPGFTHTHFEIRPDGGEPVNPYASLVAACTDRTT